MVRKYAALECEGVDLVLLPSIGPLLVEECGVRVTILEQGKARTLPGDRSFQLGKAKVCHLQVVVQPGFERGEQAILGRVHGRWLACAERNRRSAHSSW